MSFLNDGGSEYFRTYDADQSRATGARDLSLKAFQRRKRCRWPSSSLVGVACAQVWRRRVLMRSESVAMLRPATASPFHSKTDQNSFRQDIDR